MSSESTIKEIYEVIENIELSVAIIYLLVIYVFGGLVRVLIGADFELTDKVKTSQKFALGLVLVYGLGVCNKYAYILYDGNNEIVKLTIGLSAIVLVAFLYDQIVHSRIVVNYASKKLSKVSNLDIFETGEDDSEDVAAKKIRNRSIEILDRYRALFNYVIINVVISLVLLVYFSFEEPLMLIPVSIACFLFIARGHTDFIKKNGKPIEKALEKFR